MPAAGISGADDFRALAQRLERAAGRNGLRAAVQRGFDSSAPTLVRAAGRGAEEFLPRRGGLGKRVAGTRVRSRTRPGRDPGIRIVGEPNAVDDPASIDRGRVAHLTFGRGPLQFQRVRPGWFTESIRGEADTVRVRVMRELRAGLRRILVRLIYEPVGDGEHPEFLREKQEFLFRANRLLSPEAEAIEDVGGGTWDNFDEFGRKFMVGNRKAYRAALWIMLKRTHPTLRFHEVQFQVDEVYVDLEDDEAEQLREQFRRDPDLDPAQKAHLLRVLGDDPDPAVGENPLGPPPSEPTND